MSKGWSYTSGDWWIICDSCGRKIKASESLQRWDGFRVCREDWEPRHSMDFIRARADKQAVPFMRPRTTDEFISVTYVDTGNNIIPPATTNGDL